MQESLTLKLDKSLYTELVNYAKFNNANVDECVVEIIKEKVKPVRKRKKMDETEYLTKSDANRRALDESIANIEKGKLVRVEKVDGIFKLIKK
jgi:hypothetical protein